MKKIIIAAIMSLTISTTANAETVTETCVEIALLGEGVMMARQEGKSLTAMVAFMEENLPGVDFARQMVLDAYEVPRFNTEENKQRAVEDFANEMSRMCFEAFSE